MRPREKKNDPLLAYYYLGGIDLPCQGEGGNRTSLQKSRGEGDVIRTYYFFPEKWGRGKGLIV